MNAKPTYDELVQKIHSLEDQIGQNAKNLGTDQNNALGIQEIANNESVIENLSAAKSMLQLVMDNIPQFIFWKDRNSIYLGCNQNFARAAGVETPEKIKGKTDYDLAWKKEEADFFRECDRRVMENDTSEYHITEPQLQADSRQTWIDTNKIPLHDSKGNVVGILGTYEDITERKKTQETLLLYETIVATTNDLMSIIDSDCVYLAVNDAYLEIHQKKRDEIECHTVADLMGVEVFEKYAKPQIDRAFAGKVATSEAWFDYPGHGRRYMRVSYYPHRNEENEIKSVVVNAHDLTQVKKLENQLIQAQKMEAIGTLAGGLAHDFNNLLMGIQGRISLMGFEMGASDPMLAHVKGIEEYVRGATSLTDQLLGFARGGKYEVIPTDFNQLAKNALELFGRTKKEIQINATFESNLFTVEVDQRQIEQVLLNLMVNAWQAMPKGGELYLQTENIQIDEETATTQSVKSGRYIKVSITDTGIGMDESVRQRIFDPFFTTKEKKRGTGLGLASAYGIIKNHHGFIDVHSVPGNGSTFHIYLPATDKNPEVLNEAKTQIIQGRESVLIVDDQRFVIDVGRQMLTTLGYQVMVANSGTEAIEIYRLNKDSIQLVILDMIMPTMGGNETFDHLKAIDSNVRVLLSSGYSIDGEAAEILKKGCHGFIQKPFNLEELSQNVRKAMYE